MVVEEEARPPASVSRSSLKLVVAEAEDKGTAKSTEVAELGAVSTLSTGWVGALVVEVDGTLVLVAVAGDGRGGTARLSLCLCCPCSWRCCGGGSGGGCDVVADTDGDFVEVVEGEGKW